MKELLFLSRMKVKFQGPNDAIEKISLENVQLNTTQYRCTGCLTLKCPFLNGSEG